LSKRRGFKDFLRGNTVVAKFVFPHLITPDTRFDAHGAYNVSLDIGGQPAEDLKKLIDEQYEIEYAHECEQHGEALTKYANRPYAEATEGKEKTPIPGITRFKFARKAGGVYGPKHKRAGETWEAHFPVFGASGTDKVTEEPWGGSMGRVAFVLVPWWTASLGFGCRLQIEAVKIIELVAQGNVAPSAYGFEDEAGYSPEATTEAPKNEESADVAAEGTESSGVDF
jgi:hypothetical protein